MSALEPVSLFEESASLKKDLKDDVPYDSKHTSLDTNAPLQVATPRTRRSPLDSPRFHRTVRLLRGQRR